ncbi:cation diffusion facilitator family transporter [Psychrosphaera sp. B3R10]|uniref:cation diffusion facilitator family transporter n=1 Tax=unclassified Psychrosphaera TaxID=2641570 RepID=UPI001C094A0D|nr:MULTISPECIES: cation diffusion facilitator family transporter [unclassified Psychrosphaera]MBU2881758.1 cation diffusion facilitator family transporter [Psychrosphaera sp. I2R16]MBU2990157.1 cation diffusion facilitator family transporter [Psychrosphaera sp. B3R10]MDO6719933.1 cation diffusion facilitator family transporter [Psychrosphaera sp. 1_MG-2023]
MPHDHSHSHLHSHGHSHGHHHHNHDGKLSLAVFINILLTIVQIIGGVLSGSLSLIADALHNLSDAGAILIAIFARRIARLPASNKMTFGFRRAEILGALINSTSLVLVGIYLIFEAVSKYFNPQPIDGWIIVGIASVAFLIDAATAWLTYKSGVKNNLNLKATFIHNLSDAFASIVVMVAGTLIILYQWYIVDLIATIGISLYVIYQGYQLAKQSMVILMQGVPANIDVDTLCLELEGIDSVVKIWHIHVWQLDDTNIFLEAYVELDTSGDQQDLSPIKAFLVERYGIHHSTIEITKKRLDPETESENCYQN